MRQKLTATRLTAQTKGEVKRLRRQGYIPVSVQHRGQETRHYQEEVQPLQEFIRHHGNSGLLDLFIEPENRRETVMVHDIQRDPCTHRLLQVTYQSVRSNEMVKAHVPILLLGEPEDVRMGTAVIQRPTEILDIRCKAGQIPEAIPLDVSGLSHGMVLRVSDLAPSDHYEVITNPETVLVSLASLTANLQEEKETEELIEEEEI